MNTRDIMPHAQINNAECIKKTRPLDIKLLLPAQDFMLLGI